MERFEAKIHRDIEQLNQLKAKEARVMLTSEALRPRVPPSWGIVSATSDYEVFAAPGPCEGVSSAVFP